MVDPPDLARVRRVLSTFADAVSTEYGGAVVVAVDDDWWEFEPTSPGAVGVSGNVCDDVLSVQVHTPRGQGGRWDYWGCDPEDVEYLIDLIGSVAAGRVRDVPVRGGSRLEVTLSDGRVEAETGLSLPGLFRLGRRGRDTQQFAAWR